MDEGESTELSLPDKLKKIVDELTKFLSDQVKDLTTLEVITSIGTTEETKKQSTGEPIFTVKETGIVAKTIIELDGDIILRVPTKKADGGDIVIDEKLMALHKANVELAMGNWKTFLEAIVDFSAKIFAFIDQAKGK